MADITNHEIIAAFNWRQAVKKYNPDKHVADEDFLAILEAARLSPTSFGFEPWNMIIIEKAELIQKIREIAWGAKGKLPEADRFVVITAKTSEALDPHGEYLRHILQDLRGFDKAEYDDYIDNWFEPWAQNDYHRFDSPQLLHEWAARQAYIVLANMMTVAALRKIDTTPIEGFDQSKITKLLEESAGLDPKQDTPIVMLALGYRAEPARPKIRRPMSETIRKVID